MATMPPEPAVDRLRRLAGIVEAASAGEAPPAADAAWLAGAVALMAGDASAGIHDALGVPPTWRRDLRHRQRDDRLRQLAASLPGTTAARASALQAELRAYQANGWPRERHLPALPTSASPRRRLLHEVMRLDGSPPTSIRQLTAIIEDCNNIPLLSADDLRDTGLTER